MPTRLRNGEARVGQGSNRHEPLSRAAGGMGHGTPEGGSGSSGDTRATGGGGVATAAIGGGPRRESDRVVVPLRPGNAGAGKGADFWCAGDGDADR
jgi:hypothetical protein